MVGKLKQRWAQVPASVRGLVGAGGGLLAAAVLALGAIAAFGLLSDDAGELKPADIVAAANDPGGIGDVDSGGDPFAYSDDRNRELEQGAAEGFSHVLYEKSPGGIIASAKRTARWRDLVEEAAADHGVDPDLMEAMVLLESAGRPDVIAGDDPANAAGLAQILAGTGTDLLGMNIDIERSRALTSTIASSTAEADKLEARATEAGPRKAAKLERRAAELSRQARRAFGERREADPRFDPASALAGMGRYLEIGDARFGRDDLAVASYHMGIGNLETVIDRYVSPGDTSGPTEALVDREGLTYAQIFFDSAPDSNPRTWKFLSGLGDDSSSYWWRVLAAREVMRLYRDDPERLAELAELQAAKSTAEEVFHPRSETMVFEDAEQIATATEDGELIKIPAGKQYGFEVGDQLGELAKSLGQSPSTYRALTPEALATLIYIGARVQKLSGEKGPLKVTSAVRDLEYQAALVGRNVQATPRYSLHTTGNSFDILRNYKSKDQALAFQFVLDRLKALGVIDYAFEPAAIHITVSDRAEALLEG